MDDSTPLDPATITTRKDAEAFVRSITLTCRGPKTETHSAEIAQLLADGKLTEAADLDARTRAGCGADTNNIIAAGPFDGEDHAYICPKCGVKARYRAPKFPALPESEAAAPTTRAAS
jgi:hypothetical protein